MSKNLWIAAALLFVMPTSGLADEPAVESDRPDMNDALGRYRLHLPAGWKVQGMNNRLNGFVIGNESESFVAVYKDGKYTLDDVVPVMQELCACTIPDEATSERLEESSYQAMVILYPEGGGTRVLGASVFPEGIFGLVSTLEDPIVRGSLESVLIKARPGPARSR